MIHLTRKADSDLCRLCEEEVESAEHLWLNCPAFATTTTTPPTTQTKLQTPSIPTFPFSIAEGAHPALYFRSLLLRAGDVEVNPGSVYRRCTKTIRRDITPITCSSCSQPYHRTCSGLTRNKKRTQGFICRPCAGLATPTITQAMGTKKTMLCLQ